MNTDQYIYKTKIVSERSYSRISGQERKNNNR